MIMIPKYCIALVLAIIISLVIVIYLEKKQVKEMKVELTITKVILALCQAKEKKPTETIEDLEDIVKVKEDR